ncbi:hypothetical protein MAM1_0170c07163 [Mucor ambiguus]|uniref:DUF7905 domain-containing protein n=1 Tax=Mucor ambiguus TaxID=91626 RepID=A0A0C9MAT6_9FUNG|nr:hypothetical protein MAM1_0170c07163 [Mucor ambiguus]
MIIHRLLPRYTEQIDKHNMHGTFEDLSMINDASVQEPLHTPIPTHLPPQITLPGRPLDIENADEHHHDDDKDDGNKDHENKNTDGANEDTGSSTDHATDASIVVETFHISPQIRNINDFLVGPLQHNMQNAVYLQLIPEMTDTICTLNGRKIKIEGAPDDVQQAYQKFAVIQKTFHQYRKFEKPGDYHVALPVLLNDYTNEFDPPKDMIMGYSEPEPTSRKHYDNFANTQYRHQLNTNSTDVLDQAIQSVQGAMRQHSINSTTPSSSSPSTVDPNDSDRFRPPLWGLDRNFNTAYNIGNTERLSSDRLAQAFTLPSPVATTANMSMLKDFPLPQTDPTGSYSSRKFSLSSSSSTKKPTDYKPSLNIGNSPKRRVLRIVPQKTAAVSQSPTPSRPLNDQISKIKDYNYYNIKMALSNGLESVRGFKGELKLFAKIGKVLWTVKSPEVNKKIWRYDQIIDIVMRECGTMSKFTNMTTKEERIINILASDQVIKDANCHCKTAIYEFHCSARNSPSLPYKPIVLHMNQGVIDVRKVVLSEQTVAEVDWVSLDRRYDFKLALTAKHLTRCDVKPYTTFNKWVSVCPITRQMSFENVPNFLEVNYVIFKQTTRYTYHLPFTIDIIRVEKVPMVQAEGSKKINAFPGSGEAWYDFEIHNTFNDAPFKSNLNLDIGCEVPWKVQDILQSNDPANDTITNYVKNLIILIERIENALNKMPQ